MLASAHMQHCAHHHGEHIQTSQCKKHLSAWWLVHSLSLFSHLVNLNVPSSAAIAELSQGWPHQGEGTYGASLFPALHAPPHGDWQHTQPPTLFITMHRVKCTHRNLLQCVTTRMKNLRDQQLQHKEARPCMHTESRVRGPAVVHTACTISRAQMACTRLRVHMT